MIRHRSHQPSTLYPLALLLLVCSLFPVPSSLKAQISVESGFKTLPLGPDTICFRYDLVRGDTLVYSIDAHDSITFVGQPALMKLRTELVSIICDSVTPDHRYHLRITLRRSIEKHSIGSDSSTKQGGPWVGRTAYVVIDSLGNRYATRPDDSTKAALAPGGAFAPLLLPTLGESCGRQNQSWMVQDTTLLVENGVPEPAFAHTTLWRVLDVADTLGRSFKQIQYTQTALASLTMTSDKINMKTEAVIASFGKLSMDAKLNIPYHLYATSQNTLAVKYRDGKELKGKHHTSSHAQLLELRSADPSRRLRVRQ